MQRVTSWARTLALGVLLIALVASSTAQLLPKQFYEDAADNAVKTFSQDSTLLGFSTGAATLFARYSGAAYCARANAAALNRWNCQTCRSTPTLSDVSVFAGTTARGFVGYEAANKRIIVAFSGTPGKSIATWAANLNFGFSNYGRCSNCRVHTGFFDGYNSIRTPMMAAIRSLATKYRAPITVTGHSLGGAQALYALMEISQTSGLTLAREHYTFGAPRAGNAAFAAAVNRLSGSIFRLVNNADLVPHVPPMWLPGTDYRHNAVQVFHRNGQYTTCSATDGEDSRCPSALLPVSVSDHLAYAGYQFGTHNPDCASGWKKGLLAHEPEVIIPEGMKISDLYPGASEVDAINMLRVVGDISQ